ncbi:MAG: outer membrane beta-barrel protein [Flavobacterium sp.]|nr:outer membrane beta-barrel protein [Flavobacterium sp.]
MRVNPAFERNSVINHGPVVLIDGVTGETFIGDPKIRLSYDFISLPIMLKYDLKNSSWFLNGGLFFNYLVKAKASINGDIPEDFPVDDQDLIDSYKKVNTGIAVGFGKAIKLDEKNDLIIEIRENLGLSNISKGNLDFRTNALNLSVGWSFDWK